MVRTQISFDKKLYEEAKREAKRRGISLAELCRQTLRSALGGPKTNGGKAEKPWMKYVGLFDSGQTDTSERVDEILYGREPK